MPDKTTVVLPELPVVAYRVPVPCPMKVKERMGANIGWALSYIGDAPAITERDGTVHETQPLVLHSAATAALAQKDGEIERLREALARTERNRDMWKAQVATQADQMTAMREALLPFSRACDAQESIGDRKLWPDNMSCYSGINGPTMGQLRSARAALGSQA